MTHENKIKYLIPFHYGILNRKEKNIIGDFDLDNFKDISVLFSHIDGYNRNRFKAAEFYIENRELINNEFNKIKDEYDEYLDIFVSEIIKENYYGDGLHLYTKPIEFFHFLKNKVEV
jgi:hypothetical protein